MAAQFTDREGRAWPLEIDFPDVTRIKNVTGVDLLLQEDMVRLGKLENSDDYALLVNVLYVAWSGQAEQYGVTDEQFGRLACKRFEDVVRAFNEALADFFRRVGRGPMARMLQTAMAMSAQQTAKIDEQLDQTTIERLLTKSLAITERQRDEQLSQAEHELDVILGNALPN